LRIGLLFDRLGVEENLFFNREYPVERINSSHLIINYKPPDKYDIIVNRIESKYRRKRLAKFYEAYETDVINNFSIEEVCGSKIETKIALNLDNIPTNKTAFKFGFPIKRSGKDLIKQSTEIKRLKKIISELKPVISKPDLGSRGKSIILIENEDRFEEMLDDYINTKKIPETFRSTLISPEGVLIEKFSPHALDLRVVVYKPKKGEPKVFGTLARAASNDYTVAKNTSLGGVPIGIPSIREIEALSLKCMKSITKYINKMYKKKLEYYVVGVDILPANQNLNERNIIYESIRNLKFYMDSINNARKSKDPHLIDEAYKKFRESIEYKEAQEKCFNYLFNSKLLVTEINTTPDFGFNTKNLVGNLIVCYDEIIKSIID
jgi:hypothetical protein